MTQQLHDEQVDPWEYPDTVKADLLFLRAAVRRVLAACEERDSCRAGSPFRHELASEVRLAIDALRAEMAGIDGKEQKP